MWGAVYDTGTRLPRTHAVSMLAQRRSGGELVFLRELGFRGFVFAIWFGEELSLRKFVFAICRREGIRLRGRIRLRQIRLRNSSIRLRGRIRASGNSSSQFAFGALLNVCIKLNIWLGFAKNPTHRPFYNLNSDTTHATLSVLLCMSLCKCFWPPQAGTSRKPRRNGCAARAWGA